MIAGIVIDNWKLDIFKKRLDDAEFTYTVQLGISDDTLTVKVEYDQFSLAHLQSVVQGAQNEAHTGVKRT